MADMRRLSITAGVVLIVAASLAAVFAYRSGTSAAKPPAQELRYEPGGPVPAEAARVARGLVAEDEKAQRGALAPELERTLPEGRLTAKGARLHVKDGTWHEEDGIANAQASLEEPGKPVQRVLLGFARSDGAWRVILAEVMP
ncbi:hypothetical protein SPAR_03396 [Streptomyces sparsogenes DSM 40356]|uniref:Uncharacterized protein n=2 Tax=Streptomyces sparsogenes TaxID=67365 RepID=A0A1R1SRK3_9ACTN|nr:hypothetical protein SPAR_03396 [Streptomyces sparsogenes DSM 40356]